MNNLISILFFIMVLNTSGNVVLSQDTKKEFILKKVISKDRGKNKNQFMYQDVTIHSFDKKTNEKLPIMIRIDNISLMVLDSTNFSFSLKKGTHFIQIGWVGYSYSNRFKLKVKKFEDYDITFFINKEDTPLID